MKGPGGSQEACFYKIGGQVCRLSLTSPKLKQIIVSPTWGKYAPWVSQCITAKAVMAWAHYTSASQEESVRSR